MKKGFTLAEVLITMALIGVIAAMVLPALLSDTNKAKVGPSLAKMVNTLENANKLALVENSARSLDTICGNNYLACISEFLPGVAVNFGKDGVNYTAYDLSTEAIAPTTGFNTNDGMTIYVTAGPAAEALESAPRQYYGRFYTVYVDISGVRKRPNAIGRDTFQLLVDLNGSVIPFGGSAYQAYTAGDSTLWQSDCNRGTTPSNGNACAGSIADNGWRVIY